MSTTQLQQINFLELLPAEEVEQLSLERTLIITAAALLLIAVNSLINYYSSHSLQQNLQAYTQQSQRLNNRIAELDIVNQTRTIDDSLNDDIKFLGLQQRSKQRLLEHLQSGSLGDNTGFAWLLRDLSRYHHRDVSLQHIYFEGGSRNLRLEGNTLNRDAIADYIQQLAQSNQLQGSQFSEFNVLHNQDDNLINFTLSTRRGGG